MGEVYLAHDPDLDREVALKVLRGDVVQDPRRLELFVSEARAASRLNHPNVVAVYDAGQHEGRRFIVSERLQGRTLADRLREGPLPSSQAIAVARQVASGLAAAHRAGILHRDLKPGNVFLAEDGTVKLLDFGLAQWLPPAVRAESGAFTAGPPTPEGEEVMGTPGYMSPEQVRAERVDERSDIFSLGIVVAEMATGIHPFMKATRVETMSAILQNDVDIPATVPPGLARIIDHMLAKRAGARFQSMNDVAFALQLLSGSAISGESEAAAAVSGSGAHVKYLALTFQRGRIGSARFTPEGSVVYGASWEGGPVEIFLSYPGTPEARPVGLTDADVLAVSSTGELAVSLGKRAIGGWLATGTLARLPLAGGAPRKICEGVVDADWAPDGKNFAVVRQVENGFALEYPIGRRLYASGGWLSHVRFSRDGTRLAFLDHPWHGDDAGRPVVIDLEGRIVMDPRETSGGTSGLAWSPDGSEVWVALHSQPQGRDLFGYDMSGSARLVLAVPGELTICDTRPNGDMIISHDSFRREVYAARRGELPSRNLAWFDWPMLTDLSLDGSQILIEEQKAIAATKTKSQFYLRPVDGGPALHLGDGRARAISPDGEWVAASAEAPGYIELIPTGVGESRLVDCREFEEMHWWSFFPDGKRLLVVGSSPDKERISRCVPVDGGESTPAGPGTFSFPVAISPDGSRFVTPGPGDRLMVYSMSGSEEAELRGARSGEWPIRWSADGRYVYVIPRGRATLTIDRIDIESGERVVWQSIEPADPAGIFDVMPVWITPDGEHLAYSYRRCLSSLYLVTRH